MKTVTFVRPAFSEAFSSFQLLLRQKYSFHSSSLSLLFTRNVSSSSSQVGSKSLRISRKQILKANRSNPELERAARYRQLIIPLTTVRNEWEYESGPSHLQRAGEHFHLFTDLYNVNFRPIGFLGLAYNGVKILRGNLVFPRQVLEEPQVKFPSIDDRHIKEGKPLYWTLIMTNPDGHFLDSKQEVLHWMIGNIPVQSGDISLGELLCPYLPPVPPQGTGVHRIVFSLYSHKEPLPFSPIRKGQSSWLHERTFNTSQFLSSRPQLSPFTFSFFQTLWDESVRNIYKSTLGGGEPVYEIKKDPTVHEQVTRAVKQARVQKFQNLLSISQN